MSTTTDMRRYKSDRHQAIARRMLMLAGQEIVRGWHEDADVPAEDLDPDMDIQAWGDIDYLDEVAELVTGEPMPSGYASAEEWSWVREGMQDYVDGLELGS